MQRVSLNTNSNNNLVVNNAIIANTLEVTDINVTNDVFVNSSLLTPVGSIITYAGISAPAGWLICNGSEVSSTAYPRLYSVIGTLYGMPETSGNFVLPNLSNSVPLGKSNSTSIGSVGGNSSITLSVSQLPSHSHTGRSDLSGSHTHTGTTDSGGSHSHSVTDPGHVHSVDDGFFAENRGFGQNVFGTSAGTDNDNDVSTRNINTGTGYTGISINSNGDHTHGFTTGSNGSHAHTFTTDSTGTGSSIDIRNPFVVLNYIIRY
jgi:microcystin-dependent protein